MSACGLRQPPGARRRRKGTGVDASTRNQVGPDPQPSEDLPKEPTAHALANPSRLLLPRLGR